MMVFEKGGAHRQRVRCPLSRPSGATRGSVSSFRECLRLQPNHPPTTILVMAIHNGNHFIVVCTIFLLVALLFVEHAMHDLALQSPPHPYPCHRVLPSPFNLGTSFYVSLLLTGRKWNQTNFFVRDRRMWLLAAYSHNRTVMPTEAR